MTVRTERDSHSLIASECMVLSLYCERAELICAQQILRVKETRIHSRGKNATLRKSAGNRALIEKDNKGKGKIRSR